MLKECYELVKNDDALLEYIELLPDTNNISQYYFSLYARKKYILNKDEKHTLNDREQLKSGSASKSMLYNKIKQLEVPVGIYLDSQGNPVPKEVLAVYIMPNMRDLIKATKQSIMSFQDQIFENRKASFNPTKDALSKIQQNPHTPKKFMTVDFDVSHDLMPKLIEDITSYTSDKNLYIVTRGGFHALINMKEIYKENLKSWYLNITNMSDHDVIGDHNSPVPGCAQGNFIPYIYKNN